MFLLKFVAARDLLINSSAVGRQLVNVIYAAQTAIPKYGIGLLVR